MTDAVAGRDTPTDGHFLTVLERHGGFSTAWSCACGKTFVDPGEAARHPLDRA